MISWEQYALSVIGCVLLSECIIYLSDNLHYEKIIRLVCGALLTITVLEPIISLDGFDFKNFDTEQFHSEEFVNAGKMAARHTQELYIKEACESYILSVASEIGEQITAEISIDENLHPSAVRICGKLELQQQKELEQILEKDLGITKENHLWIWSQEKDSS